MNRCVEGYQNKQRKEHTIRQKQCTLLEDNRGLSLVELMVALAITVIIMGAATLFLHTSIKNYQYAAGQIDLQKESQVAMEQMVTWVMEGNVLEDRGNGILVIYDYPRPIDTASEHLPTGYHPEEYELNEHNVYVPVVSVRVIWQGGDKLYMVKSTQPSVDDIIDHKADYEKIEYCAAENIENYSISVNAEQTMVDITMDMKTGKEIFSLTNSATVRNYKLD